VSARAADGRAPAAPVSLGEAIARARGRLAAVSPTPGLDAEVLAAHALHCTRASLITSAGRLLHAAELDDFEGLVDRRARGEPVAYLTGVREFWTLELQVTPEVLIPRPESELLVETALARMPAGRAGRVLDLGTGSGALALSLAHERPDWQVVATDREAGALAVARANAARLGVSNVDFRHGTWWAAVPGECFDVVVCNPPYVADADPHLRAGDARFEPRRALCGGADGLREIRAVTADAGDHLAPGGVLLVEHGYDQGAAARDVFRDAGFDPVTVRDLAGHERVTYGIRR